MNVVGTVLFAIMGLGGAFAMRDVVRLWRHEPCVLDAPFPYWIWGAAAWRAARRAATVTISMGSLVFVAILIVMIAEDSDNSVVNLARGFVVYVSAVLTLVMFGTAIFNRPKLLVPPHLRSEPGLLRDLLHPDDGGTAPSP